MYFHLFAVYFHIFAMEDDFKYNFVTFVNINVTSEVFLGVDGIGRSRFLISPILEKALKLKICKFS
jgi:hypothetical protein